MTDRLGSFFDAYGEYLRGERDYNDIPMLPPPDCHRKCVCPRCEKSFVVPGKPSVALHMQLCSECDEIMRSGRRVPLPVARVLRRPHPADDRRRRR